MLMHDLHDGASALAGSKRCSWAGRVREMVGLLVASDGPAAAVGDFCEIRSAASGRSAIVRAQVVGFRDGRVLLMPLEETGGLQLGRYRDRTSGSGARRSRSALLGRVLDGFGKPMDGGPGDRCRRLRTISTRRLPVRWSASISRSLWSPAFAPSIVCCRFGKGQRIGIFGGSGVGKSTLLGAMARHNSADVSVIALIGERNREVREFLEKELSAEGLKRSVVVVRDLRHARAVAHSRGVCRAGGCRIFSRLQARACCW